MTEHPSRTIIALSAVMLLLPGLVQAQRHGGSGIEILWALYGQGERTCDAGRSLAQHCQGQIECFFESGNRLCGDPARGERKALAVAFSCGRGRERVALFQEGGPGELRCAGGAWDGGYGPGTARPPNQAPNRIVVERATYGAGQDFCEASDVFARACDGRQRCELRIGNRLCGDPARGRRKAAEITFWCNGRREFGTVREDEIAYLSCP